VRGALWGLIVWLIWWRLMASDNEFAPRALLFALALLFLGSALPTWITDGLRNMRANVVTVAGLICLALCLAWPQFQSMLGARMTSTAIALASNFRTWFVLLLLIWVYGAIGGLILLRQRHQMADVIENDMLPFRQALARYVLPRRLSEEQSDAIAGHLKKHEGNQLPIAIVVQRHDREADMLRGDIVDALMRAGWSVLGLQQEDNVPEGLHLHRTNTVASAAKPRDPHISDPFQTVWNAFQLARTPFDGGGSGSSADAVADTLTIKIGRRRRDSDMRPQAWPN
jgi:hypothetical protein